MPVNTKYIASFKANQFFHIIAKAAGNGLLFHSEENRRFFLKRYLAFSWGYFDTYSYVLMDNHVHWLIKCNSHEGLLQHLESDGSSDREIGGATPGPSGLTHELFVSPDHELSLLNQTIVVIEESPIIKS